MGLGALRRLIPALPLLATLAATGWALSTNPLAAPMVERSGTELALTLERQVRRAATTDWIAAALADAVANGDADRAEMLIGLARDLDRPVDTRAADVMIARQSGPMSVAADCARCMADTATCATLNALTFCAVPFELTPLGDLNALRRAAVARAQGLDVDELDAGLAVVGLAATGAILFSGGTSTTVKAGATLLRVARRIGSLTPALTRAIRVPVRWSRLGDVLSGTARLEDITDTARIARLGTLSGDLGRVRRATSTGEALRLMRLVDTPEDAARLARVAEAAGPRTTRTFAVLGKSRVFRATLRLSRATLGALVLIWLTMVQLAAIIGTRLGALSIRWLARRLA